MSATTDATSGASGALAGRDEVTELLHHEAALLDAHRFDTWLDLFTDDAVYWVPQVREDPERRVSLVYDDRRRLAERVARIRGGFAFSQQPLSRTVHLVGNIRVLGNESGATRVASNIVVTATRRGRGDLYSGTVEHILVPTGAGLRIRAKTVRLIQSDEALGNLTFLL
ncbi:aromatic-ring-hydroxylating dioxygenase subunit beta [Streptomyces puniciscabiei]